MDHIFYWPLSPASEPLMPVMIGLNSAGEADLSPLPARLQQSYRDFGVPNSLHTGCVYPEEGVTFLMALLKNSGPYAQYTESI